jgi:D-sedoheptulose 7-phosphate isomerase
MGGGGMSIAFPPWRSRARVGHAHLATLSDALVQFEDDLPRIREWGLHLAEVLGSGGRLLAAGNGGSAAHAQHLTSELVGRYREERRPLSAICLCAESSSVTAIANDYGGRELFARQVHAHGREGDVLVTFSTSGASSNVVEAVRAARSGGITAWALTGCSPNPLAALADDALCIDAESTATVQEVHQVAIHLLCEALDSVLVP